MSPIAGPGPTSCNAAAAIRASIPPKGKGSHAVIADAHTRVRRSIMLTPGHQEKRLAKAAGLPVDCVAFDLEDAVPPQQKAAARRAVSQALTRLDFDRRERIVRITPVGTVHLLDALRALPVQAIHSLFVQQVGAPHVEGRLPATHRETR